jgi:hypothetical protein
VAQHYGRPLTIKGMKKVEPTIEPLNGREIGRLLAVLNGDRWLDKRNVAIVNLMVRAGLRASEQSWRLSIKAVRPVDEPRGRTGCYLPGRASGEPSPGRGLFQAVLSLLNLCSFSTSAAKP